MPSPELPYPPDDDANARTHIINEITDPRPERWRAMTTDTYLLQTYRVLVAIERDIHAGFATRKAEIADVRAKFTAGEISDAERRTKVDEYNTWKKTNLNCQLATEQRRRQIVYRVRALHGDLAYEQVRDTLLTLARAVDAHRHTLPAERGPVRADRILWTRLATLQMTLGHPNFGDDCARVTLADAILANDPTLPRT
jgi:hypothetical protein